MSETTLSGLENTINPQQSQGNQPNEKEILQNESTILKTNEEKSSLSLQKQSIVSTEDNSSENIESELMSDSDRLKERYFSLKREMEHLEQQKGEQFKINCDLRSEIKQLKEINNRIRKKEDKLDLSVYKLNFYQKQLEDQELEFGNEKKNLKKIYEERIKKLKDNPVQEATLIKQEKQILILKEELQQLQEEKTLLSNEKVQLLNEKIEDQTKNELLQKEVEFKENELLKLQSDIKILQISQKEKCKADQVKDLNIFILHEKIDDQNDQIAELKKDKEEMKIEIHNLNSSNEEQKKINQQQKKINEEQKKENENSNKQIVKLNEEINEFRQDIKEMKIETTRGQLYTKFIQDCTQKMRLKDEEFYENKNDSYQKVQEFVEKQYGISPKDWETIVEDKRDRNYNQHPKFKEMKKQKEIILTEFFASDTKTVLAAYKKMFEVVYES